jgi:hypothetical protein
LLLDGARWQTAEDFYDAFLRAVRAPSWHGHNFNALRDSITVADINAVSLPYDIVVQDGSERYSEDMDLDADPRLRQRLKAVLRKTLHAPTLRRALLILGIRDLDVPDKPAKDTDTVLRYKLRLIAAGVPYPTKIEVSYRGEAPAG